MWYKMHPSSSTSGVKCINQPTGEFSGQTCMPQSLQTETYTVTGKNGPPKQNAVKCTIYNTI